MYLRVFGLITLVVFPDFWEEHPEGIPESNRHMDNRYKKLRLRILKSF
jgi:hypothetical protein